MLRHPKTKKIDWEYYNAVLCYELIKFIGYKYPHPVNGFMVYRLPKFQSWLGKQIPFDNW